jgi:hypothetical protein
LAERFFAILQIAFLVLDRPPLEFPALVGMGLIGSAENSSSMEATSELPVDRRKGAVGRATPKRTGARREFAVSQSSSTAMLIKP